MHLKFLFMCAVLAAAPAAAQTSRLVGDLPRKDGEAVAVVVAEGEIGGIIGRTGADDVVHVDERDGPSRLLCLNAAQQAPRRAAAAVRGAGAGSVGAGRAVLGARPVCRRDGALVAAPGVVRGRAAGAARRGIRLRARGRLRCAAGRAPVRRHDVGDHGPVHLLSGVQRSRIVPRLPQPGVRPGAGGRSGRHDRGVHGVAQVRNLAAAAPVHPA